ncbi:hypothetical protein SPMU_08420 [Sphingomonas mucosissima]|uniref:Uncharacterized protein n=1 Tax=Sphingomonas mucosissima TaxID=370959 RepID=A0A245ZRY8_9SPHN|nr:hypothetical protein SPMU_08420 [Sphingomonas mucosissima]
MITKRSGPKDPLRVAARLRTQREPKFAVVVACTKGLLALLRALSPAMANKRYNGSGIA